jgi:hypothetical protein
MGLTRSILPRDIKVIMDKELFKALEPLQLLDNRERSIFLEYHYFKTHMRIVAASYKICLSYAYKLLYRAEDKLETARAEAAQEEAKKT